MTRPGRTSTRDYRVGATHASPLPAHPRAARGPYDHVVIPTPDPRPPTPKSRALLHPPMAVLALVARVLIEVASQRTRSPSCAPFASPSTRWPASGVRRRAAPSMCSAPSRSVEWPRSGHSPSPATLELIEIGARHDEARGPLQLLLVRRVGRRELHQGRRVDLVLRQVLAWLELKDVEPTRDLGSVNVAIVPVRQTSTANNEMADVERATIEKAISCGCAGSVKS